jgi:HD-GYP domain-containing protein (c-di-GMP phosphodiesterase class II)
MDANVLFDDGAEWRRRIRATLVLLLVLTVTTGHWWIPHNNYYLHLLHVILRKLYLVPIVLAAIWFNLRGGLLAAASITVLYSLHVIFQWGGERPENINQAGEIATIWVVAALSGILFQAEKRALQEVAETHEGSLTALVAALDAREHDTELHSLRVRAYALRIGLEVGLDQQAMKVLGQASLLHDVGKIGTPDNILLKPGSLNDEEWHLMRKHPETGRRVLLAVPFLKDAAEVVHCHHERYDGSGYPKGLRGDQIPLLSRIFAVVDVFDALTCDRPYRKRLSCEDARKEMREERGKLLDPEVVDTFLKIPCSEWKRIENQVMERAAYVTGLDPEPTKAGCPV